MPRGESYEVIFVDDGSTDGTREWLRTFEGREPFRVILNEQNLGYARANNRGAAAARGEFLLLLNNDLILTPGWLEPMAALADRRTEYGIIGNVQLNARTGRVDHSGIFVNAAGKPQHEVALPLNTECKTVPAVTGACLLIRRTLWSELGGFDEQYLNGGEDIDLCLEAQARGHKVGVALKSVILHHISASPGRKKRDEQNSYLLTRRWRRELEELATDSWCRHYAEFDLNAAQGFAHPWESLQVLAYLWKLRESPPAFARQRVRAVLDHELCRWRTTLDFAS